MNGMHKCGKFCTACPHILETKTVQIQQNEQWQINRNVSCNSSNIIYMIECQKTNCKEPRYIGETHRLLKHRLAEHRGYVNNKIISQATGAHFTSPGHTLSDLKIIILELVKYRDTSYRKEREEYFIKKFNTFYEGMNKQI